MMKAEYIPFKRRVTGWSVQRPIAVYTGNQAQNIRLTVDEALQLYRELNDAIVQAEIQEGAPCQTAKNANVQNVLSVGSVLRHAKQSTIAGRR